MVVEMEFQELDLPAEPPKKIYSGNLKCDMSAGNKLEMKAEGSIGSFLERIVPEGKSWKVTVNVNIEER